MRDRYLAWRKKRAHRKAEKILAQGQRALDILHGRHARPTRRRGSSSGSSHSGGDWGDVVGDLVEGVITALFKFFD